MRLDACGLRTWDEIDGSAGIGEVLSCWQDCNKTSFRSDVNRLDAGRFGTFWHFWGVGALR